jgi:hypothetical protein
MMVDMGAGTTEFSISHVNEQTADHRILCYFDSSILLGGNQFEAITSNAVEGESRLIEVFLKEFHTVWYKGFEKDKNVPAARARWRNLNVVLAGGGLKRPSVEHAIRNHSPLNYIFQHDNPSYEVSWHTPIDIQVDGHHESSFAASDLHFLAVAHGLSLERQKWPISFPPNEVETLAKQIQFENPFAYSHHEW